MPVVAAVVDIGAVDETGLVDALDRELLARYPHEAVHGIDADAFRAADGCFVLARDDTSALGCGAFRRVDAATAELKRMYTAPGARGRGVARIVLRALEDEARRRGYRRIVLETGDRQPEAIGLYIACGYATIAAFGPFVGNPSSVFFGKELGPA